MSNKPRAHRAPRELVLSEPLETFSRNTKVIYHRQACILEERVHLGRGSFSNQLAAGSSLNIVAIPGRDSNRDRSISEQEYLGMGF